MKQDQWKRLNNSIVRCRKCPRLINHCQAIGETRRAAFRDWEYWARPVPNLGLAPATMLIVGLAPAAHGANRTGRMFTGDRSGQWLFRALHRAGFANQGVSESASDGLKLHRCAITAVCHCAPPANKPRAEEIDSCHPWLEKTLDICNPSVILALGGVAWKRVGRLLANAQLLAGKLPTFQHGRQVCWSQERHLLASYHPSQQNTFTGRLTEAMLDAVLLRARELVECESARRTKKRNDSQTLR